MHFCVCRTKSQLKRLARPMYSNPPIHGARIVTNVVGNPALFDEWKEEMEMMAGRIKSVRQKLFDSLTAKDKSGKDWSFILKQIGMFSFTGLNKAQVNHFKISYISEVILIIAKTIALISRIFSRIESKICCRKTIAENIHTTCYTIRLS